MKKRLLAILICAFMITGLLPGTAVAVSTYVTVGGVELDGTCLLYTSAKHRKAKPDKG